MNQGYTGIEIAEMIEMPPALEAAWHTHGYYGSVSHNVKAIYQRYLGWFDGNPANLWQHPPVEAAARATSTALAAPTPSSTRRSSYIDDGDLRFAAELLNHVVFADDTNAAAARAARRRLRARSASAPRTAPGATSICRAPTSSATVSARLGDRPRARPTCVAALTVEQLFDSIAIRINGPKAWDEHLTIDWVFTDLGRTYRTELTQRRA